MVRRRTSEEECKKVEKRYVSSDLSLSFTPSFSLLYVCKRRAEGSQWR
jgi:hypothetical protein